MSMKSKAARLPNVHPGEVLFEEFLKWQNDATEKPVRRVRVKSRRHGI